MKNILFITVKQHSGGREQAVGFAEYQFTVSVHHTLKVGDMRN